jgi:hypothetical protein
MYESTIKRARRRASLIWFARWIRPPLRAGLADYAASILSSSSSKMVMLARSVNGWLFIRTDPVIYPTRDGYENSRRRHLAFCDDSLTCGTTGREYRILSGLRASRQPPVIHINTSTIVRVVLPAPSWRHAMTRHQKDTANAKDDKSNEKALPNMGALHQ